MTMTAEGRYEKLKARREDFLQAAYDCAAVTIPALFPKAEDARSGSDAKERHNLPTPNQDLGSRGVNNLSAKLLLALFPPNNSIMRYIVDAGLRNEGSAEDLASVEEMLSGREVILSEDIEASRYRPALSESTKQLLVAGSVLLNLTDEGMRMFRLDRYVVKRGRFGVPEEIILKEGLDPQLLPDDLELLYIAAGGKEDENEDEEVDLYTVIRRDGKTYNGHQEFLGEKVDGTDFSYPLSSPQWMALSLNLIPGMDYGRGYVSEYLGALQVYDSLQGAIQEDAIIAAMTVFLVDPNGTTSAHQMEKATNGQYVHGRQEDVTAHRVDKQGDMSVAFQTSQELASSLSFAFLLNSAVRRNAERVTAEEIREIARELEDTLGGVYSVLADELQMPLVLSHEKKLERQGKLDAMPEEAVHAVIVTGLEGLGRGHDLVKLTDTLQDLIGLAQIDESAVLYLETGEYLKRLFTARGVSLDGLMKTKEQVDQIKAAQAQAAQAQSLVETMGPEALKQGMIPNPDGTSGPPATTGDLG